MANIDPRAPMGPIGRVGSTINVAISGILGSIALVSGIVNGDAGPVGVGLGFWGMCALVFVPIMLGAIKRERNENGVDKADR